MNTRQSIAGDVGVFSSEHAQRLLGIVHNETDSILANLHTLATKRTGDVQRLYAAGLNVIPAWSDDVIKAQLHRVEIDYPDFNKLHKYCYLLLKKNMNSTATPTTVPSTNTFYAKFLKHLCASSEVRKVKFMTDVDFVNRRSIVLHCLRMTYHDLYVLECETTVDAAVAEAPLPVEHSAVDNPSSGNESPGKRSTVVSRIESERGSVCFFD